MQYRSSLAALTACALIALSAPADPTQKPAIYVYVSAGDPAEGFVDPAARDSAEDLKGSIAKKDSLRLVAALDKADVWLRVDRRFKQASGSQTAIATGPKTAVSVAVEEQVVVATLLVGDYSLELVGNHTRSWRAAAGKLAGQLEKWVNENQERLLARRAKR